MQKNENRWPGVWNRSAVGTLSALLFLSSSVPAFAFPDVESGKWYAKYINYLQDRSMVSGYPDNSFKPYNNVTRAEFAAMLAKAKGIQTGKNVSTQFNDVPSSHWASGAVSVASSNGWITGYPDGTFGPDKPITHSEMYTIVSKLINSEPPSNVSEILDKLSDGASVPTWAQQPVAMAVANGVYINEVTPDQIEPFARATRADVAGTFAKLVNDSYRTPMDIASSNTGNSEPEDSQPSTPETVVSTGTLRRQNNDWLIETVSGLYTIAANSFNARDFRDGQQVNFRGDLLPPRGSVGRRLLRLANIDPLQRDENVSITGILRRANRGSGWAVNDHSGRQRYVLFDLGQFENRPWFKDGAKIDVQGVVRKGQVARNLPPNVEPLFVQRVSLEEQQVAISGTLRKAARGSGWAVNDSSNRERYVLFDLGRFENRPWFKEGASVDVRGVVKEDATARNLPPNVEALFVQDISARREGPAHVNVVGRLDRTVEAGGWIVTDRSTREKYLLMELGNYQNRRWFQPGRTVRVEGTTRPNRPNIHMEGTPLAVTDMQAM